MKHFLSKLSKRDLSEKIVLVRVDFNITQKNVTQSLRFTRALETIHFLKKNNAKIVVVSHRGRPLPSEQKSKKAKKEHSLEIFKAPLKEKIKTAVYFDASCHFSTIQRHINELKPKEILLLENIRLWKEEERNSASFAKKLASLANIYVNDAFAVSHRTHASVARIATYMPAYAGLTLEKEIKNLSIIKKTNIHPLVFIIGGVKATDKIEILSALSKKIDTVLVGGGVANTFFQALQIPIGASVYDKSALKLVECYVSNKKIILPDDVVIKNRAIVDIGEKAQKHFCSIIKKAKMIVWNGPLGYIEDKNGRQGTRAIVHAVFKSKAYAVIGGGETQELIGAQDDKKNIFISTGGGALLAYLSGKKMPGIDVL